MVNPLALSTGSPAGSPGDDEMDALEVIQNYAGSDDDDEATMSTSSSSHPTDTRRDLLRYPKFS